MTFNNYKTIKCKYFESGFCKNLQNCTFAHGDQDMRQLNVTQNHQMNGPNVNFSGQMMAAQYNMGNFQNGQMEGRIYDPKMMMMMQQNYQEQEELNTAFFNQLNISSQQPPNHPFMGKFDQQPNGSYISPHNIKQQQQQQQQQQQPPRHQKPGNGYNSTPTQLPPHVQQQLPQEAYQPMNPNIFYVNKNGESEIFNNGNKNNVQE